jgi:hypothetical protein
MDQGQPVPANYNPADWIMKVAQANTIEALNEADFFPSDKRILMDPLTKVVEGKDKLGITITKHDDETSSKGDDNSTVGYLTQAAMLFTREICNLKRDKGAFVGRMGFLVVLSCLIGVIFYNVGEQPSDVSAVSCPSGSLKRI